MKSHLIALFAAMAGTTAVHLPAQLEISNTLSRYAFAIDSKDFDKLEEVFTPDIVANYSAPLGVLRGIPNIQETLKAALLPVTTQHSLTTQTFEFKDDDYADTVS